MATVSVRDDAIWLKHIEGDRHLLKHLEALEPGQIVDLEVDGVLGQWQRMRHGRDGRPTYGIRPVGPMREVWARLRPQIGRRIQISEPGLGDSYLVGLEETLSEWNSAEDEVAYRDL